MHVHFAIWQCFVDQCIAEQHSVFVLLADPYSVWHPLNFEHLADQYSFLHSQMCLNFVCPYSDLRNLNFEYLVDQHIFFNPQRMF